MENRYLFRGKRKDNGEWVFGDLVHSVYKIGDTCVGQYGNEVGMHEVDPETVCQCTGGKDKNSKLIWENDIVKINNSKVNTVITFRDFEIICTIPNEKYYKHRLEYDTEYEVIGNIFDNPELLEV